MNEKICRLCLQTIGNYNCQAVEETLLKCLELNLNISKENVMCIECATCIQGFSNFTAGCGTLPLSDLENSVELDPEPIEATSNPKSLTEAKIKCSFCTKTFKREDLISLQISNGNEFLVNMLKQYISETNLKNTEDILTCDTCLEALERISSVILKCLEVEEKISKYIELKGTNDKGQVQLKEVQQFTFRPVIKLESDSFSINKSEGRCDQIQEECTMMVETEIKDERQLSNTELIIKTEEDDIGSEQSDCDISSIKWKENDCDGFQEPINENETPNDPLHLSMLISEMKKSKDRIKQYPSERETFKCELCSYKAKRKANLRQQLLIHKSPFEIKMFKCKLCSHEAKVKWDLQKHLLVHKSSSEIKMYKCELCPHESKRKCDLKKHSLTHKSSSEIEMFKCALCSYKAKRKFDLKRHLLIHKSPSDIKMFKCELCSYDAKQKCLLRKHLLTHKGPN